MISEIYCAWIMKMSFVKLWLCFVSYISEISSYACVRKVIEMELWSCPYAWAPCYGNVDVRSCVFFLILGTRWKQAVLVIVQMFHPRDKISTVYWIRIWTGPSSILKLQHSYWAKNCIVQFLIDHSYMMYGGLMVSFMYY
jgi:hypothetical protein